ncbi:MAG: hypothetical protein IJ174_02290, partial [Clostridia bacterium]|nr:hypothetical protein [Clostridia bacterium]
MQKQSFVRLMEDGAICAYGRTWHFDPALPPCLLLADGKKALFSEAVSIVSVPIATGLGSGVRTRVQEIPGCGGMQFETEILVNDTDGHVDFTFSVLREAGARLREVMFPGPLQADGAGAYAVVNTMQGQLIPADWPEETAAKLPFDGQMCSESAYMPWWGEVTPGGSYLAVVRAPWDTKYAIHHPAGGPTRMYARHLPSLGKMAYQRTISVYFLPAGSDYVALCRLYRAIADEAGKPVTLREKAAENPNVEKLIGACVMHVPGKKHVTEDSRYYDREHLENNDS